MTDTLGMLIYAVPLLLILFWYQRRREISQSASAAVLKESRESGLTEPASLHPVIDPTKCIGCKACISACPEMPGHQVLGLFHGKAELISPTECIGHGACKTACPVGAISLVFGTERRGVDIPNVKPNFETNVPGIFIAGELGGMGLIRNAIEQGRQAMDSIRRTLPKGNSNIHDVLIVGAGPAGLAASLAAHEAKLRYVTVEQESLGGTVAHYPRGKLVMTAPGFLPIIGKFRFRETTREKLLEFWTAAIYKTGVEINYNENVESVERSADFFQVKTNRNTFQARRILLAIGRRGSPRKLDKPGEDLPKVTYRLIDPAQYRGKRVLIVGGGDSALEAACSIADEKGTEVTLSYRSEAFGRAKTKNRERLQQNVESGRVKVMMKSQVHSITPDSVELEHDGQIASIPNDAVIINAGGILPTGFLRDLGIDVETKFGTA